MEKRDREYKEIGGRECDGGNGGGRECEGERRWMKGVLWTVGGDRKRG